MLMQQGTNDFHPLTPALDKFLQAYPQGYYPFASIPTLPEDARPEIPVPTASSESEIGELMPVPQPPPPGSLDPDDITDDELDGVLVMLRGMKDRLLRLEVCAWYSLVQQKLMCSLCSSMMKPAVRGLSGN